MQWYEFFGNIELGRAKVANTLAKSTLNFDKLPADAMFLTGQTLRVRTEPPPLGSPPVNSVCDYVKVWKEAYVSSATRNSEADIITYDSEKDLSFCPG